jgi:hypothetical protein
MISYNVKKMALRGSAVAAASCLAVSLLAGAVPNTAPNVTYTASGTFASPQVSGADSLKLAGEPFTINIVANAASVPIEHGPNWAVFSPLKMTGTVHSGLIGATPVNIASGAASIQQAVGPTVDIFETAFPVKVVGIALTIHATVTVPAGTISNQLIHPFAAVPITPTTATVVYSNGDDSTTLDIQVGSLVATIPQGGNSAQVSGRLTGGADFSLILTECPAALAGSKDWLNYVRV